MDHSDFVDISAPEAGFAEIRIADPSSQDPEALLTVDRVAFAVKTGAHLYGTADAESDLDFKAVYLEPLGRIVLGRDEQTRRISTASGSDRNAPGDFDAEFIELRKFITDALDGQTYAVELLHAPSEVVMFESPTFRALLEHRDRLVSRNVEPFIGYCRTQAHKYGLKGRRLASIEAVIDTLEDFPRGARLEEAIDAVPLEREFVEVVEQPIRGQPEPVSLLEVAGKRYELQARIKKALDSLRKTRDSYGARSRRARDGVDWKAVSHAYRVAWELKELLETGAISFPLERAEFIRDVKRGRIDYGRVESEIPELVETAVQTDTELPDQPDRGFWEEWIVETYLGEAT